MRIPALLLLLCFVFNRATGQEAVYFFSDDSIKIKADLYLKNNSLPFIILCHHEGSSRAEFTMIAPRLLNLNYNCLAIDLRPGYSINAVGEIKAAIQYARGISNQPVVLFGSSYSASLCLLVSAGNPKVRAVIALNPGEFFRPLKNMEQEAAKIRQPVFACATQTDYLYIRKIFSATPADLVTLFKPAKVNGIRGIEAFYDSNPDNAEYWFALMMFFKKINTVA